MSREKSEKDVRNVPITVRLNEEEHEKLKQCAAACGLSAAEFMRQLCKGNAPQPKQVEKKAYHTRNIDTQKTMNMGQVLTLIEASRETPSSYPIIPIPDYICCSTYGRPRTKDFHWRHYKKLLEDNGLPRRSPAIY